MLTVIVVIVLILLMFFIVFPLFIRKEYTVSSYVLINKPKEEVFDYVKYLGNQVYFNKWVMADPNVRRTTTGTDATVGFRNAWDSDVKSVGKGEQEITNLIPGTRIDSIVRFEKPFKNVATVSMTTEKDSTGSTRIGWVMDGKNSYPMNIMNLFIPGMLGKDMTESLGNLKKVLEK